MLALQKIFFINIIKGEHMGGFLSKLFGAQHPREIPKLGRNDLCWCGSGKKYKRCHMDSDMAKRSRILDSRCRTRS